LVVGEGVPARGEFLPDPLDAERVQPDERQREACPELELHLLKDVLRRDDEDSLAAAAASQLRQDHADLDRLAEPHSVGEEDTRAEVVRAERELGRTLLVRERVGQGPRGHREVWFRDRYSCAAHHRLQPQPCGAEPRRVVGHHAGLPGVARNDAVKRCGERGRLVEDDARDAGHVDEPAITGTFHASDEPFFVPDLDDRAWSELWIIRAGVALYGRLCYASCWCPE